jgi:hypothetical protein
VEIPHDLSLEFGIVYADGLGDHVKLGHVRKNGDFWELETTSKQLECATVADKIVQTDRMIFVGGPVKSGTTWFERCLNGHPDVLMTGENSFFNWPNARKFAELLESTKLKSYQTLMPSYERSTYLALFYAGFAERIFRQYSSVFEMPVVGDKSPGNALTASLILQCWPKALYVHCNRHPLDVCVSRYFFERLLVKDSPESSDLTPDQQRQVLADESRIPGQLGWMFQNRQLLQLFLDNWISFNHQAHATKQIFPDRIWIIRYEEMLQREAELIKEVLNFIGVSSSSDDVDACAKAGSFEHLSGGRRRGEIDELSFYRRGEANTYSQHLSAEQITWSMAYLGSNYPHLEEDGYAPTSTQQTLASR